MSIEFRGFNLNDDGLGVLVFDDSNYRFFLLNLVF